MRMRLLFTPFLLVAGMVFFSSCKKPIQIEPGTDDNTGRLIIEFRDGQQGSFVNTNFSNEWQTIDLTELRWNPRSSHVGDVKVKIVLLPGIVGDYNDANGTSYLTPPISAFNLEQTEFTLSHDQRSVMVRARVLPSVLATGNYAVGLAIAETEKGEISSVARTVFVSISVKNEYDGIYSIKGYANIPSTAFIGPFELDCSAEVALVTSGVNSVSISPGQFTPNGAAVVYLTNVLPNFEINSSTNLVTNVTAMPGSLAMVFPQDPGYNSRFDPATKTLYVKYGISSLASGRYFIDTLVYCRPR